MCMRIVFDIEANGLLNEPDESKNATRIHCLSYHDIDTGESGSITNYDGMKAFLAIPDLTLIGHKIITYDIPLLEKLLDIKVLARLIDTLGLSWYLYPNRIKHGLDEWGEDLGIKKPPISDWQGLLEENWEILKKGTEGFGEYELRQYNELRVEADIFLEKIIYRCQEDVKINTKLFKMQVQYLKKIYDTDATGVDRIMSYLSFKLDCAAEQEQVKVKIDRQKALENLAFLNAEKEKKASILSEIMPVSHTYKTISRPKIPFKKDGSISAVGERWFALLKKEGLPDHHLGAIKVIDKTGKGNPNSHAQLKEWLFSLGWQPDVFKYVKDKPKEDDEDYTPMSKDTVRSVPQISTEDGSDLSDSVKDLFEVESKLIELDSYFKINHRIGCIQAFLDKMDCNDFVKAEIAGFTNTLRFKHSKPIVNMPTSPKKYWEMVRGCIIAPSDEHVLCGADMSSLESNTKQHYMYFFDSKYVTEMRTPGFDEHIDIAKLAKDMSYDEGEFFKWYDKRSEGKIYEYLRPHDVDIMTNSITNKSFEQLIILPQDEQKKIFKQLKDIRFKSKRTNFAAVYGAGPPKIALTARMPLPKAKQLHTIYWMRNKAVKQVAAATRHKTVDGQMWLYNPVSKFWYSLRFEKDKFSTLNQGTGVYCFDMWIKHVREQQIKIAMQYHDEKMSPLFKGKEDEVRDKLQKAIKLVNEEVKLNVPLGISVQFGTDYASIH